MRRNNIIIKILAVIIICIAIATIIIFVKQHAVEKPNPSFQLSATNLELNPTSDAGSTDNTNTQHEVDKTKNGQVYPGGYELFVQTEYDYNVPNIYYVDDGVVDSGKYAGYHKIIAGRTFDNPDGFYPAPFGFITKDYNTFLFTDYFTEGNDDKEWLSKQLNKQKVTGNVTEITFSHPKSISLGNFILTRNYFFGETPKDLKPLLGKDVPGFTFYYEPLLASDTRDEVFNTYTTTDTTVYVKDQNGVIFSYVLASKEMKARMDAAPNNFSDGSFYNRSDITSTASLYETYGSVFPHGCGQTLSTYVLQNIDINNLKKIGTTKNDVDLYVPFSAYDEALAYEYKIKITQTSNITGNGKVLLGEKDTKEVAPPTFEAYSQKYPVLIFKDVWGRWVGLGEYDYQLGGGCGKPVIYLYPETATEVNVSIAKPVTFTHDIPKYDNGWKVLAHPNGSITDLNKKTNCDLLDSSVFGLEYAKVACQKNNYPYLFWSGNIDNNYPTVAGGFVVKATELKSAMTEKLNLIGLTEKEISDMEEYWIPEIQKKNAPYYRLTFFQTDVMNQFIPMSVSPIPDTLIRIFLDWAPLTAPINIQPETLKHVERKGFTLVEWGGLKQ